MFQSEPGYKALRTYRAGSINLRKRRTWYEGEGKPPTPDTAPGTNGGGSTGATFTQADVDRIVGERAKRAKETGLSEFLKELGFEKADDLKALVTNAKAKADSEKSDLEKAQAELERWKTEAESQKAAFAQMQAERQEERRQSAILNALREANAKKATDLLILVNARFADDVAAVMSEEGAIDDKAIKALMDKVSKEWADQFQSSHPGSPSVGGGKTPKPDNQKLLDEIKARI